MATETDVHVVASGGYYMQRFYPPEIAATNEDQIAEDLAAEAARNRLGAFGEIGQNSDAAEMTPEELKVSTIMAFLEAGHADKLLVSSDFTGRRSEARPGYGNSITMFAPLLREAGVDESVLQAIQRDNPRRFLAFVTA